MTVPLPSWRPGVIRDALVDFVDAVTTPDTPTFVPERERIAVFDNDGTLWCEQPVQVQVAFSQARLKQMARTNPAMADKQPYKAFLEHDLPTIHALGKKGVFEVAFAVHAGMTVDAFMQSAGAWLADARHPRFGRRYVDLVYQPQLELMSYLRANGFQTWIVSGGGADFIRQFAEKTYGVPPSQVIGSTVRTQVQDVNGRLDLFKLAQLDTFDDREVKVESIGLHIGRRPIFAFGNSDGDLSMMRYTLSGPGRRLALLLHHDDAEREVAYDRDFRLSPLVEALDHADAYGLRCVSMARDWATVFPPEQETGGKGAEARNGARRAA
ncbi:HAD family hydrolase [Brevundimonas lenta]|uniref:Phosphoserine phosphatase n=1 Tax=Brevundimonas lenta TaxID=424796 RepID=A0A7W6JCZ3_9CAUL|nr:HAD family hydrolase [Brevundimonas lenta]MBB4082839.1 phosphoserine phosphatase [Brevundimonas lenta]